MDLVMYDSERIAWTYSRNNTMEVTYQCLVEVVGVRLWIWFVHGQGYAIGKYSQENKKFKRSEQWVKEFNQLLQIYVNKITFIIYTTQSLSKSETKF